jgi:hypothetical protein
VDLLNQNKDKGYAIVQAYAAVKFADACLRGLRGDAGVVECAFVASEVFFWKPFFVRIFTLAILTFQ